MFCSIVEKQGGGQTDLGAIHDFQHCISRNGLIYAGYQGENFNWCNRWGRTRIWERLDQVPVNLQLQTKCESLAVHHIVR